MKTQKILSVALYLTLGASAFAGAKLPSCSEIAEHANIGAVCRTQAGFQFKRYQNPASGALAWEDVGAKGNGGVGGKIWYDAVQKNINIQDALHFCDSQQLDVPSLQDYKIATSHGIKEIFKDAPESLFWTNDHELSLIAVEGVKGNISFPGRTQTSFITYPYQSRATLSRELNIRCNGVSGVNTAQ